MNNAFEINEKEIGDSETLQETTKPANRVNAYGHMITFIPVIVLVSILFYLRITEVIDWNLGFGYIVSQMLFLNSLALGQESNRVKSQAQQNDNKKFRKLQNRDDTKGKIVQIYIKWNRVGVACLITLLQIQLLLGFDQSHPWIDYAYITPLFTITLEKIFTLGEIDWIIMLSTTIQIVSFVCYSNHLNNSFKFIFILTYFCICVVLFRYIKSKRTTVSI